MNYNTPQCSENIKETPMSLWEWQDNVIFPIYFQEESFHFNDSSATTFSPAQDVNANFSDLRCLEARFQHPAQRKAERASLFGSPKNSENSHGPSHLKSDGLADFAKVSATQSLAKQEGNTLMFDSTNIDNCKSDEHSNAGRYSSLYNTTSMNQDYSLDNQCVSSRSCALSIDSRGHEFLGLNDIQSEDHNDSDDEETVKGKKSKKNKQTRWKKADDCKLLVILKDVLKKYTITFNEISEAVRRETQNDAVNELVTATGWKQPPFYLIKRIEKLNKASEKLTTREVKKLRKLYYKMKRTNSLDWEKIYYMFPAKKEEMIKDQCNAFKRCHTTSPTSSE